MPGTHTGTEAQVLVHRKPRHRTPPQDGASQGSPAQGGLILQLGQLTHLPQTHMDSHQLRGMATQGGVLTQEPMRTPAGRQTPHHSTARAIKIQGRTQKGQEHPKTALQHATRTLPRHSKGMHRVAKWQGRGVQEAWKEQLGSPSGLQVARKESDRPETHFRKGGGERRGRGGKKRHRL